MGSLSVASLGPRDIYNYLRLRSAEKTDDVKVGLLLIKSFVQTYRIKLPQFLPNKNRLIELQDVQSRREGGEVYVLELGEDSIIGTFGLIHPDSDINQSWKTNSANLRCVAVDPAFQGIGLSHLLLKQAIQRATAWKVSSIALHVQKGAEGVANLYKKFGFRRDPVGDMICANGYPLEAFSLDIKSDGKISDKGN